VVSEQRARPTIPVGSYAVHVGAGLLDDAGEIVRAVAPAHRYAIITDDNVGPLYAERVREAVGIACTRTFTIAAGEAQKTREQWMALTDAMLAAGMGRDTTVLALGGGVVGDLAGFTAATYMRGVPFVQMPTTLLAMIDASIGGKTGVDTTAGKNLVGAFHRPAAVLADPAVLTSLPLAELRSGAAEAIKHGAIADAAYFESVARELPDVLAHPADEAMRALIFRSIEIKASVVRRDEREGALRKILNFGHTLGHAVESESGYRLLHGEAVAIGMVLESTLGERLGMTAPGTASRVRDTLLRAGLPVSVPRDLIATRILAATRVDKKARDGVTEYALVREIGVGVAGVQAPDEDVLAVLAEHRAE
jgi:3-dehydroquinate synthase